MIRIIKVFLVLIVLAAMAIVALWLYDTFYDNRASRVQSMAPTLDKIQDLSELVTSKVYVSDVLDASNKDYEGKWVIYGDALITIDLSKARINTVNEEEKTATILLPRPEVSSPRVDHTMTKQAYIKGTGFALLRNRKNKAQMKQDMLDEAQRSIETFAGRPEIIENARMQASLIISNLYLKVGWTIRILWEDQNTEH